MRFVLPVIFCFFMAMNATAQTKKEASFVLVIHGGAGTILKKNMNAEKEEAYKQELTKALQAGYDVLKSGGAAMDAVQAAIMIMEDSPLFNAGKGSVYTGEETVEMDAAVMDGKTLNAGSVAGVKTIRNPITAARAVMEKSKHVMMVGKGAEQFAGQNGIVIVDTSYFHDDNRLRQLRKAKEEERLETEKNKDKGSVDDTLKTDAFYFLNPDKKFGTVGAVALDQNGNLAAGTSTGGMTNKKFGRVGDSPVIGAGTYANNKTCAVSCTGHGEYFIRNVVAHDVSAMMEYGKLTLEKAANKIIHEKLVKQGGSGGLIALDKKGNFSMPFNTEGMYRGYVKADGKIEVLIYK
ncbi:MAG TPA: isoaspartyl peptidase/L-asparaginase [Flavobacteriales bacterium]|nr:isoaspartyl peptidase/L-asparaginase [Flavobacteriales bacterium]